MRHETALAAADRVIANLYDRSGFDHWWDFIKPEIKQEIRESLAWSIIGLTPPASGQEPDTGKEGR